VTAAAALAALDVIDDPDLLASVRARGERFAAGLAGLDGVAEVRGRGLMLAAGLQEEAAADVSARALEGGLVINVPAPDTLRFLPPLVIGDDDVAEALEKLEAALSGLF
jgi:acetylornithine/succinyldiaminopimelate/putrescine aminotransferase